MSLPPEIIDKIFDYCTDKTKLKMRLLHRRYARKITFRLESAPDLVDFKSLLALLLSIKKYPFEKEVGYHWGEKDPNWVYRGYICCE